MSTQEAIQQELSLLRSELKGIESELLRLTDRRFEKMLAIAKHQGDLNRIRFNIPAPSAASRQFEADRESQAVGD